MELKAVIFDLDDTLLDTGALRAARGDRYRETVKAQLDEVRPFPARQGAIGAEAVPAALSAQGLKVGIVTRSPRWYAEASCNGLGFPSTR